MSVSLSCPICYSSLDADVHIPKIIPSCGHTVCAICLDIILNNEDEDTPKCPLDKKVIKTTNKSLNISHFPVNYSLVNVLEGSSDLGLCEEHNEEIRFICKTDKKRICDECACSAKHKGHDIMPFKKLKTEVDNRIRALENLSGKLDTKNKEVQNDIEKNRSSVINSIKNRFEELKNILHQKEEILKVEVNSFFMTRKDQASSLFGNKSTLKQGISEDIARLKSIFNQDGLLDEDLMNQIDGNIAKYTSEMSPESFLKQGKAASKGLSEIANSFNGRLDTQTQTWLNQDVVFEDFLVVSEEVVPLPEEFDANAPLKTIIELVTAGPILWIVAKKDTAQELNVDFEKIKTFQEVSFLMKKYNLSPDDHKAFNNIWKRLAEMKTLTFKFSPEKFSDNALVHLAKALDKPAKLKKLVLDLTGCQVYDKGFVALIENVFSESIYLESLDLKLSETSITNDGIELLTDLLINKTKRLEEFSLDIKRTSVTDRALSRLISALPPLRSISLQLNLNPIGDGSVGALAKKVVASGETLKNLEVNLHGTKVSDCSLGKLFAALKSPESLVLSLNSTTASDESLVPFVLEKLPLMTGLKKFKLDAGNTNASYEVRTQIDDFETSISGTA